MKEDHANNKYGIVQHNRISSAIDLEPDNDNDSTSSDDDHEDTEDDDNEETTDDKKKNNKKKKRPNLLWLLLYVWCIPIVILLIATIMGSILALIEKASFVDCMLYVASNLLGLTNALTDYSPTTGFGVVVDVYVGVVSLIVIGIVLEYVSIFDIPGRIDELMEICIPCCFIGPNKNKLRKTFIAFTLIIPGAILLIATIFGLIMAAVEGWTVKQGILYVLGNLLGLANPLTDIMPESIGGDLLDIWISGHALACVALFIDYVTTVDPARFIRKKAKKHLTPTSIKLLSSTIKTKTKKGEEEKNNQRNNNSHSDNDYFEENFNETEENMSCRSMTA